MAPRDPRGPSPEFVRRTPAGDTLGAAREASGRPPSSFWRRLAAFIGPAYLVAVGYVDPGNWATDIAGGSAFGYSLLSVILLSNLMAMLLQSLAAKLGIITGRDLAQACRDAYSPPVRMMLWLLCEIAIIACDLAEVIGTAIALQLLFGLPLVVGVVMTGFDVLIILALRRRGLGPLESLVVAMLAVISICFAIELALSAPSLAAIAGGLIPSTRIITDPAQLYLAIAIIGATVMPHNLYLHSALVKRIAIDQRPAGRREAVRFATIDTIVALALALMLNAAILILAAATFHRVGMTSVAEIQEAYHLLSPIVGAGIASTLFAIALLAAGQSSTLTATMAGQIVMEGFLDLQLAAWKRRLITRLVAIVPAVAVAAYAGVNGTARLLVLSQVILSLQLPFAVVPLVQFTSSRAVMGEFANPTWLRLLAWTVTVIIIGLNVALLLSLA